MNTTTIETKLLAIENLLYPYQEFWQNEILDLFLQNKIPSRWLSSDFLLDFDQIQSFEMTGVLHPKHPWYELSLELSKICDLPKFNQQSPLPYFSKDVKAKKIHEISQLLTFMSTHSNFQVEDHLVDLAGGKGHLSYAVLRTFPDLQLRRTVIDNNVNFKFTYPNSKQQQFLCLDLFHLDDIKLLATDHLCLLHGCGELSDKAIDLHVRHQCQTLHLVGCCYHLIKDPISFISFDLKLTGQALHLATKTHRQFTQKSWDKLHNQKHYRYSFAIWFDKKFATPLPALKSSTSTLYQSDFKIYATEQLNRLKIDVRSSYLEELQLCYLENYNMIEKLIRLGTIRLLFSRSLELYICLTRALKLSKSSKQNMMIGEIFNKNISPRNILIYSRNT